MDVSEVFCLMHVAINLFVLIDPLNGMFWDKNFSNVVIVLEDSTNVADSLGVGSTYQIDKTKEENECK